MHAGVGRIIVHITHHEHFHSRIKTEQTVFYHLSLARSALAIERTGETAWPVAYDNRHILARQLPTYGEETTGLVGRILGEFLYVRHQSGVLHREECRIIEQRTIDASLIGTLDMAELHVSCLERRLRGEIFQHVGILNLSQTDEGTAHVRQHIGTHVGKCTRHILELIGIFHTIPSLSREILVIILTGIMAGIEEVLLIIETHSIHLILLVTGSLRLLFLCRSAQSNHEEGSQQEQMFSHTNINYSSIPIYYICSP